MDIKIFNFLQKNTPQQQAQSQPQRPRNDFRRQADVEIEKTVLLRPGVIHQHSIIRTELYDLKFRIQMARMSGIACYFGKPEQPPLLESILRDLDRISELHPQLAQNLRNDLLNVHNPNEASSAERFAEAARVARNGKKY
jgi:hypothetical protein